MEEDEALELLRHPKLGAIDLTGKHVQQLKDKKARHVLEKELKKALPRRRKGIEFSSYYQAFRVKLLSINPYFRQDTISQRELFHIPEGQIKDIDLTRFPRKREPWSKAKLLDSVNAAGFWLTMHRCFATKVELDSNLPPLPKWLKDSAATMLDGKSVPGWLQKTPKIPVRYAQWYDLNLPIDKCVVRLIERYQLPWTSGPNVRFFILTQQVKYLEKIFPLDVRIESIMAPIGEAFTITVDCIDEYTTREKWNEIWEKYVIPRQEWLWEQRGDLPHSKQLEIDRLLNRLKEPWVMELYGLVQEQQIRVESALDQLSLEEKLPRDVIDRLTAYRMIRMLSKLMKPLD